VLVSSVEVATFYPDDDGGGVPMNGTSEPILTELAFRFNLLFVGVYGGVVVMIALELVNFTFTTNGG